MNWLDIDFFAMLVYHYASCIIQQHIIITVNLILQKPLICSWKPSSSSSQDSYWAALWWNSHFFHYCATPFAILGFLKVSLYLWNTCIAYFVTKIPNNNNIDLEKKNYLLITLFGKFNTPHNFWKLHCLILNTGSTYTAIARMPSYLICLISIFLFSFSIRVYVIQNLTCFRKVAAQ